MTTVTEQALQKL